MGHFGVGAVLPVIMVLGLLVFLGVSTGCAYAVGKASGRKSEASVPARLIEQFRDGYKDGYKNGCQVGAALTAESLLEKYKEGYNAGHIAGEDAGVASIEVLTDKEIELISSYWRTERKVTDMFVVIAGCRNPRVVRGSATLMNKSKDEIAKRISQLRKPIAIVGGIVAGHPGAGIALAVAFKPKVDEDADVA